MKPRIRLIRGIWHCRTQDLVALGYTPRMAYLEWKALMEGTL